MEEKTKLLQLLHDREECENIISEKINKKQKTVEDIEKMMGSFSKVKPLIVKSLLDYMDKDYISKIMEDRKKREENYTNSTLTWTTDEDNIKYGSCSYFTSNIFDPENDSFIIYNFVYNEDKTKVRFNVECTKLRRNLGITGGWIPSFFCGTWIDIEDLRKAEEE